MKILVLSLYYEPDRCQSNGPIIRALCEDWAAAGHEVTVLASFPHYSCPAVWPEYRRRLLQWDRVGPVRVIRSYIYVAPGRSSLGRILNYLSFNISSLVAGLLSGRQDVIFAISPPLTIGISAWLLSLIKIGIFTSFMATGSAALVGVDGLWNNDYIAWKAILFACITAAGQWIEYGFRDFVPAFGDLIANGETPERHQRFDRAVRGAYPPVLTLYALVVAAAILGIASARGGF